MAPRTTFEIEGSSLERLITSSAEAAQALRKSTSPQDLEIATELSKAVNSVIIDMFGTVIEEMTVAGIAKGMLEEKAYSRTSKIEKATQANSDMSRLAVVIAFNIREDTQISVLGKCTAYCSNCRMPLLPNLIGPANGRLLKYQICNFKEECKTKGELVIEDEEDFSNPKNIV